MERETIALNLRRLRSAKGANQTQLAAKAGISRVAYRDIETGASMPKVSTLENIARALEVRLQDLVTPITPVKSIRFRALKKMASREQVIVDVTRWLEDFTYLEDILGNRMEYRFQDLAERLGAEKDNQNRPLFAAIEAREVLGLTSDEPIRDICGLLDFSGIKVYPMVLASDAFFGLSVSAQDRGPAIVVNVWDRISVERWIFSAVHELGHLFLHLDAYDVGKAEESESEEIEANTFASYFLMPGEVFEREWRGTYGLPFVERVLKVKRIFRVSYRTVLYRLATTTNLGSSVWQRFQLEFRKRTGRTLSQRDEPEALPPNIFQTSFPETLRAREPDNLSASDFIEDRLSALVRHAIEGEEISLSRGAEIMRLDLGAMRERVASWI